MVGGTREGGGSPPEAGESMARWKTLVDVVAEEGQAGNMGRGER